MYMLLQLFFFLQVSLLAFAVVAAALWGFFAFARSFSSSPDRCWGIRSVLKWSLNTAPQCTARHDTRDSREKKHTIHHESLRPGRQRRHQAGHLSPCRCFYLPSPFFPRRLCPSIHFSHRSCLPCCFPAFHLFSLHPSLSHSVLSVRP